MSGLLVGLWSYLVEYENNTPQHYISSFLKSIEQGDIELAMKQVGITSSKFLTSQDYRQYMYDMLGTDFSNLKVIQESENGEKLNYTVSGIETKKIGLELSKKAQKKEFGIDAYTIKQILPLKSMKITAPANAQIQVNGTLLSEQEKTKIKEPVACFQTLESATLIPQLVTYEVSGFLYEPKITVQGLTPQEYILNKKNNNVFITLYAKSDVKKQVEEFALKASKAYAHYISKDAPFSEFSQYLVKDSSYYKSIRYFDNSWYISHDSTAFANEKANETLIYSDTCFSTTVSFDYIVSKEEKKIKRTFPTKYKVSIMKQDKGYKIVNLQSI
ncbi:hypothetical protein RBG61_02470 [Paludicola sp. MB14-C6]|uniref:hypothetical protein n=1 Tax=Paludihabitans sp. MB14-C6 TaxID=3070656 RepID=UPI0027DAC327|nr:hypothetical protein [Paludicola sp. MB14-C6]WMJ23557.1 hypothetical protein RBG61_02470 [Paludicola sp. MB14-C6]